MRNTFVKNLEKIAEQDERIVLLTADMGYKLFDNFAHKFPGRFFNVGIAEQNMVSVAAGLAHNGLKPFVYTIAPFLASKCVEQIRNDVAYHKCNVTLVGVGAGLSYGFDGASHFAVDDIAILRSIPNLNIICPGDPIETAAIMEYVGKHDCGPTYLRLGKSDPIVWEHDLDYVSLQSHFVFCPGRDVQILSCGNILDQVVNVKNGLLHYYNVDCGIISVPTVKPFGCDWLKESFVPNHIVTIEEHSLMGGFGSSVAEYLSDSEIKKRLLRIGIEDREINVVGDQTHLRNILGLSTKTIYNKILSFLSK